jgi:hypothetical protein
MDDFVGQPHTPNLGRNALSPIGFVSGADYCCMLDSMSSISVHPWTPEPVPTHHARSSLWIVSSLLDYFTYSCHIVHTWGRTWTVRGVVGFHERVGNKPKIPCLTVHGQFSADRVISHNLALVTSRVKQLTKMGVRFVCIYVGRCPSVNSVFLRSEYYKVVFSGCIMGCRQALAHRQ